MRRKLVGYTRHIGAALLCLLCLGILSACTAAESDSISEQPTPGDTADVTLVIGAYSVVKDAMADLLPRFREEYKEKTGQTIRFQESYEASGTQARAIAGGFEADVTLLAMEGDVQKLVDAGLVAPSWKERPYGGMITRSIVVMGVREGNPRGIRDFPDLTKPGVKVLYPNPKTSGGAQWDINALYGAGLKMSERQGEKSPAAAKQFLVDVHRNVESLDKSGRASMAAFEYGVGDVIITYENELLARIAKSVKYEVIIPRDTIRIENPAAIVDANVEKHGNREAAEALLDYLQSDEAQRIFAKHGFRSVNEQVLAAEKERFPDPVDLFDIEYLGGWDAVRETLYSKRGVWYQVLAGL